MNKKRKLLPAWLVVLLDVLFIASYVLGFYAIYYLSPRELVSTGIKTAEAVSPSSETTTQTQSGTTADIQTNTGDSTNTTASVSTDSTSTDTVVDTNSSAKTIENLAAKFADHFTDTVQSTGNSYSSPNISIKVDQYTEGSGNDIVTYYVADIYVADITSIQSGFADNTYGIGYTDTVLNMDESLGAILAMNGDYYGNGGNGVVIRNGEVYRSSVSNSDVCVLYYDGTMKTFSAGEFDVDQAVKDGAWQAWSFGPALLDASGNSKTEFNSDRHVLQINPRSAIGYYEPGHYCMVVVDGRQNGYSRGLNLSELSQLFKNLGCTAAYNMDGGKSSQMTFNDTVVNRPSDGGREVSDSIIIKEVNQ